MDSPRAEIKCTPIDLTPSVNGACRRRDDVNGIVEACAAVVVKSPARVVGLTQPDVSRLLRGDFREYSLERLFRLLTALGHDIDIVIRQPRSATGGKLRIAASEID